MRRLALLLVLLGACAEAQPDPDRLRAAKELVFDKKYGEARAAWQQILAGASGGVAETAAYWVARCSESLGENERALREYGQFLDRRPSDRALVEEARTSRVGLAAKLVKAGERQHLGVLTAALQDPNKTVRYYGALQLGGLGKDLGMAAVPVLKDILAKEQDEDLVERAKILLLRLEPSALSESGPAPRASPAPRSALRGGAASGRATWIRVRVYEKGEKTKPQVSINMPLGLAELVYKSLPDDAMRKLKEKGYDAENFWEQLGKLGPMEILTIEEGDGGRVQIWLE